MVQNGLRLNFVKGSGGGETNKCLTSGGNPDHRADYAIRNTPNTQYIMSKL